MHRLMPTWAGELPDKISAEDKMPAMTGKKASFSAKNGLRYILKNFANRGDEKRFKFNTRRYDLDFYNGCRLQFNPC